MREEEKADRLLSGLYGFLLENPTNMPMDYIQRGYVEGMPRSVCDFIACMTDRYAVRLFQTTHIPDVFTQL